MITLNDLDVAIAECQGERNPNANTCIKLAAFYTIKNELYGKPDKPELTWYSTEPPQVDNSRQIVEYDGKSDFAQAVKGMSIERVMSVIDELMTALYVENRAMYRAVLRQLSE